MKISLALLAALLLTCSVWAQTPNAPVVFTIDPNGHVSGSVTLIPGPPGPPGNPGTNGTNGKDGAAATVAIGTVTTGAPGSPATVVNVGTPNAAIFNFTIPQGSPGDPGPPGPPTPYPGVASDGANGLTVIGKIVANGLYSNGPPPNGITVGTAPGANCNAIAPSKPTCKLTIVGGVVTTCSGC
jgi:hypothetical protein